MGKSPRVILLTSPKGGVGKSSLTEGLAVAAATSGLATAVVDFDVQRTVSMWHKRRGQHPNVADLGCIPMSWDRVASLPEQLAEYDVAFIDTPTSVEDHLPQIKQLLGMAHLVLIPTGYSAIDRESVIPWMGTVKQYVPSAFVLNRVRTVKAMAAARRELNKSGLLCPIEIGNYEEVWLAQEVGLAVSEIDGAKSGRDICSIWDFAKNLGAVGVAA
jgi:chromosome partitioning protein